MLYSANIWSLELEQWRSKTSELTYKRLEKSGVGNGLVTAVLKSPAHKASPHDRQLRCVEADVVETSYNNNIFQWYY